MPSPDRILVVDDEEGVAVTIQAVLEMDGHKVKSVTSGTKALEQIRKHEYDLVLSDLRLDDVDGIQIIQEVRRKSPDTIAIILTGYASLDSAVKALHEGAYDYLLKPCDVEELRATVERGLERRRLAVQLRERLVQLEAANSTINEMNADLQRRIDEATAELRRNVERLTELDDLKSQFMSIASHELKTPITAMSGFLQVVTRRVSKRLTQGMPTTPDEWQAEQHGLLEQLEIAKRQTAKLARLIDELLDVSRIQSGRVQFELASVDVAALAREVGERMQHTTQRHTVSVEAPASLEIVADRDHLEQVLNNLVGNAIKYSPDGGDVHLVVAQEKNGVGVTVRDQGIGIPPEELESVFGLFYRSPDKSARDVGGMGLGLYISRQIVDRHGGRIWGESERREGSAFHVWLPREAKVPGSVIAEQKKEPTRRAG